MQFALHSEVFVMSPRHSVPKSAAGQLALLRLPELNGPAGNAVQMGWNKREDQPSLSSVARSLE